DEAYGAWLEQGVPPERIHEFGMKDNFWQMADTGPCGPNSEIHYDMGPAASEQGHTDCAFGCECGRYIEIWNLVFMQFDRDAGGNLNPLPAPSIDTGMGLERMAAVLQGVTSTYDTDLFVPLIHRAAELTGVALDKELQKEKQARSAASLRVIADHARATTFLISDGVLPSNEGRGYVLRKIMRRAIRHGRLLGQKDPFLYQMVFTVRELMKDAYPELVDSAERVARVVEAEERRFAHTLALGLKRLEEDLAPLIAAKRENPNARAMYSGAKAFKLYDTFGLPLDFIQDAVRDAGIEFDPAGFDQAMSEQRARAQASWKGTAKATASPAYQKLKATVFEGYERTESSGCEVLAIIQHSQGVQALRKGDEGEVILDHTPFYAEAGGQVGDRGWLYDDDHNLVVAEVTGCYMPVQGVRAHRVLARENLHVGDRVDAVVNLELRQGAMRHHTATHLVHAALREVLGKHVKQAGSLVAPDRLRFDFSHFAGVEDEELQDIEDLINKEVLANERVEVIDGVPLEVAIHEYKAMALFGEKYGERVRVVKIGDFSTELCGGTHTSATGEIGLIKILDEGSVSSGVRRVDAVAGESSLRHFRADHELEHVARSIVRPGDHKGSLATALERELQTREEEIRRLRRELEEARMRSAAEKARSVEDKVRVI